MQSIAIDVDVDVVVDVVAVAVVAVLAVAALVAVASRLLDLLVLVLPVAVSVVAALVAVALHVLDWWYWFSVDPSTRCFHLKVLGCKFPTVKCEPDGSIVVVGCRHWNVW